MTRFSIWSLMPRPWRPPAALQAVNSSKRDAYRLPFRLTGSPCSKATVTSSGSMRTSAFQKATPMIGLTIRIPLSRNSRSFASWVAPRQLASVL